MISSSLSLVYITSNFTAGILKYFCLVYKKSSSRVVLQAYLRQLLSGFRKGLQKKSRLRKKNIAGNYIYINCRGYFWLEHDISCFFNRECFCSVLRFSCFVVCMGVVYTV